MKNRDVIEHDLWKWDYRHQVVSIDGLSRKQLFFGMKMIEAFYHLHPKRLGRMVYGGDARLRRQVRFAYRRMTRVFFRETFGIGGEFIEESGRRSPARTEEPNSLPQRQTR